VCTADFRADEAEEQAQDTPEENAAGESGDGDAGAEEPAAEEAPEEEAAEEEEEEEPVDPKPEVEESCKPRCVKQLLAYQVWHRS